MSVCVGQYGNCGSRSSFYVIDNKRGFKEFDNKEAAEYAHCVQSKLSMNNLAPLVLSDIGKIRYRLSDIVACKDNGMTLSGWGYITEIAEMIGCGGNDCECGECADIFDTKYRQVNRLVNKIEDMGLEFIDAHVGNVGYVVRRGRQVLVCVDCGSESVYDPDLDDNYLADDCGCEQCKARRYQNA